MNYGEKIREKISDGYTITVKSTDGVEFNLDDEMFESFCVMIVKTALEDSTPISNDSLQEMCRWIRTIKITNCGEIWSGLNDLIGDSDYKRFFDGLLESVSKVSIETHKILR